MVGARGKKIKSDGMEVTNCPKCKSDNLRPVAASYPKAFECMDCKTVFVESKKALIDE